MSARFSRESSWRDLDLAQMHLWPSAARRWTIAVLALAVLCMGILFLIWPRYEHLLQSRAQISTTQAQILSAVQAPAALNSISTLIPTVSDSNQSAWLTGLAQAAHQHHLTMVVIKARELDEAGRTQLRDLAIKSSNVTGSAAAPTGANLQRDASADKLPSWLTPIAQVNIEVQGRYSDVLAFASELGASEQWLGVGSAQINGLNQGQVKWQAGLWYQKERNTHGK